MSKKIVTLHSLLEKKRRLLWSGDYDLKSANLKLIIRIEGKKCTVIEVHLPVGILVHLNYRSVVCMRGLYWYEERPPINRSLQVDIGLEAVSVFLDAFH